MNHILKIFPLHIRGELQHVFETLDNIEEIRVRVSQPIMFLTDQGEYFFSMKEGHLTKDTQDAYAVTSMISATCLFLSAATRCLPLKKRSATALSLSKAATV